MSSKNDVGRETTRNRGSVAEDAEAFQIFNKISYC